MIDSEGRTYIKIYCCGDCVQYNWTRHRCGLGAHVNGTANDCFYLDCPFLKEEKEPRWIPVSERLPKNGGLILITNDKNHVRCGQYRGVDFISSSTGKQHWHWKGNVSETVIAWMPLPKPYQEADHD